MKRGRLERGQLRPFSLALPILVVLGCGAEAQSGTGAGGYQGAFPPAVATAGGVASAAGLEGCRADVLQTLALYRDVLRSDEGRRQVDRAGGLIALLGPRDLEVLAPACAQVGQWKLAVANARDLARSRRTAPAPARVAVATAVFPTAPYSGLCGSTRSDTDVIFGFQVALQVARGVWSAASRACDQVAVVCPVPGGGNTSLACIAADAVLFAAEKVLEDMQFCDEDIDSAEIRGTYDRVGFVHDQVVTLEEKLDAMDKKLDALVAAVEGLRQLGCDTVRLENTPEGRRSSTIPVCGDQPGFPYNWPQR
jgi:hypothetical protein